MVDGREKSRLIISIIYSWRSMIIAKSEVKRLLPELLFREATGGDYEKSSFVPLAFCFSRKNKNSCFLKSSLQLSSSYIQSTSVESFSAKFTTTLGQVFRSDFNFASVFYYTRLHSATTTVYSTAVYYGCGKAPSRS